MTSKIKGYYVIEVNGDGRREMGNGAGIDAFYGYEENDRCITIDGLIFRGSKRDAVALAKDFSDVWAKQGADYSYSVRPLLTDDYFGAYQKKAVDFVGNKLPA